MRWLVKTDPVLFAWEDLAASPRTTWDGVRNPLALKHLRRMRRGEEVLVYHGGRERRVVGIARVLRGAYVDVGGADVVDLEAVSSLARPVARSELAELARLESWELIRVPRLTVLPVPGIAWRAILRLSLRSEGRNRVS